MASSKEILAAVTPQAEELLASLLAASFDELVALPPTDEKKLSGLSGYTKPVSLNTYRHVRPTGDIQIVVQLMVAGALGSARFWVQGFTLAPQGKPVRLTPEELYDFH